MVFPLDRAAFTPVCAIILFAFGVLVLTAVWQSLWLDEVYSIWYVRGTFSQTWARTIFPEQNPHASLYYALFWAWLKLVGTSELAARFFSIMFGTLGLVTAYRLARDGWGVRPALVAALFMAVSPFFIWYAQEARQYALYLFLGLLSTLCLSRALGLLGVMPASSQALRPTRRVLYACGFVVSATAMAYSHYFGVFIVAAQFTGAFLVLISMRRIRRLPPLIVMGLAVAALCAPIPLLLSRSGRTFDQADITRAALSLPDMLQAMLAEFMTRLGWLQLPDSRWLLLALPTVLIGIGLVWLFSRDVRRGVVVLSLLLVPALAYWPLSARVSVFTPKYVIVCFPFFVFMLAVGIDAVRKLSRLAGLVVLLGALGLFGWGTVRDLTQPDVQRENWRFAGDYLSAHASPSDAVLVFADYAGPVIEYYYPDGAAIIKFAGDPGNPAPMFDLAQQKAGHMLWVLLSHDQNAYPNHKLLDVAYARYPWAYAQYPSRGNIRLLGFTLRWRHDRLPEDVTPVSSPSGRFANGLALIGYHVDATQVHATDRISHPPSNWIHIVTYWQRWRAIAPVGAQPALRLVSGDGGEWGGELSRRPDVFDFDPPERWDAGTIVEAHYDLNLNPATPPGAYHLEARMMNGDKRLPLDLSDNTSLVLMPLEIVP